MKSKIITFLSFLFVAISSFGQIYNPVSWSIDKKITGTNTADIIIRAKIEKGWHLYGLHLPPDGPKPTVINFNTLENATKIGNIEGKSKLTESYDPNFDMKLNWYASEAVFVQKVKSPNPTNIFVKATVNYMVCNNESCLPPTEEELVLGKSGALQEVSAKKENTVKSVANIAATNDSANVSNVQTLSKISVQNDLWKPVEKLVEFGGTGKSDNSLGWIFLAGLIGGLLALFTPCVWPIIPMTVSFFLKRSKDKQRGRRDAVFYGLSIVLIYVGLGLLITIIFGASALNSLSTNAIFNLIFFALLLLFAISFFGAFEITLPASWSTRIDAKADATAGFISILFMAFTLVLVSFSCTGPIIGTLLVEASVKGSILGPAVGMLGFAIALAIPFSFFAFFPSLLKSIPKSGGWLNNVKVVLAFLELAFSLKFLSVADLAYGWHLLDRETFLALWIVIFALLGVYFLGKLRFPHDSETSHTSVLGLFLGIISLAFSVYMIPGLWGAPLKAVSAFAPPVSTQDFNLYSNNVHARFTDYEQGLAYAAQVKKPVVIDFTGYGCVNCRKMEVAVWTDSRVRKLLNDDFVLVSLFVDDKKPLKEPISITENGKTRILKTVGDKWSYLQRHKFGANAQPYYVILDENGNSLRKTFYKFDENPSHFVKWLEGN